jgi:hypothetical protein
VNGKHKASLHEKEKFAIWSIVAQTKEAPRQRVSMGKVLEYLPFDWDSSQFASVKCVLSSLVED